MAITPLPEPPSRSDPSTFAAKGDAFLAALSNFVAEANALLAQCEQNATTLLSMGEIETAITPLISAVDASTVKLTGDQTVTGIKTFNSSPVIPNATTTQQPLAYGQIAVANADPVKAALNASGNAPIYACRAWVVFNGTGTVSIRKSANVTSITDRGTGQYRVNFTTAMADINWSGSVTPGGSTGVSGSRGYEDGQTRTTSYWEFLTANYNGSSTDCAWVNVIIFN